jgi:adenosine deaminase CECR1
MDYPSIKTVWAHFSDMFNTVGDVLSYVPVYKAYHMQMLEELYNDGIIYVELRTSLKDVSRCQRT